MLFLMMFRLLILVYLLLIKIVISEEIVINKKGQSVLLNDDGTWTIMSSDDENGKVVFSIVSATDKVKSNFYNDDMDETKSYYLHYGGCEYIISVKNNTKFKVKVVEFKLKSNREELFTSRFSKNTAFFQCGIVDGYGIIEPGKSLSMSDTFQFGSIMAFAKETKKALNEDEKQEIKKKFGCEAQKGSISVISGGVRGKDIIFSKEAEVEDIAKNNYIMGSSKGIYPLIKRTNLK